MLARMVLAVVFNLTSLLAFLSRSSTPALVARYGKTPTLDFTTSGGRQAGSSDNGTSLVAGVTMASGTSMTPGGDDPATKIGTLGRRCSSEIGRNVDP